MTILNETNTRTDSLIDVAKKMMTAARTAPKGCGVDNLSICLADRESIESIAQTMKEMVSKEEAPQFFARDADNILASQALVLIGTKVVPLGLSQCGLCGFANCEEKNKYPSTPCSFNTGDLGIAIGSAVSLASDNRVDNRIMFSVGKAVKKMNLMGEDVQVIYGIPLSCSGKSPFFDRK